MMPSDGTPKPEELLTPEQDRLRTIRLAFEETCKVGPIDCKWLLSLLASREAEIATLRHEKREQEKEHADDIVQLVREIATLRQERDAAREHEIEVRRTLAAVIDEAAEAIPEPGRIYEYGLSAVTKLVQAKEAAEAENARLRGTVNDAVGLIVDWLKDDYDNNCVGLLFRVQNTLTALLAPPAETDHE